MTCRRVTKEGITVGGVSYWVPELQSRLGRMVEIEITRSSLRIYNYGDGEPFCVIGRVQERRYD